MNQDGAPSEDATSLRQTPQQHPEEQASSTKAFSASWTPSKAQAFNPSALPRAKAPRAWDRKATQKKAEDGRVETVWKRYELRGATQSTADDKKDGARDMTGKSPGKVVKKARVGAPVAKGLIETEDGGLRKRAVARKYERRKSGYARRKPTTAVMPNDAQGQTGSINSPVEPIVSVIEEAPVEYPILEDAGERQDEYTGEELSQEGEATMTEAADAQLLGEAGAEPLSADFNPLSPRAFDADPKEDQVTPDEEDLIQLSSDVFQADANAPPLVDEELNNMASGGDVNQALAQQPQMECERDAEPVTQPETMLTSMSPMKIFGKLIGAAFGQKQEAAEASSAFSYGSPLKQSPMKASATPEPKAVTYPTLNIFDSPAKPAQDPVSSLLRDDGSDEQQQDMETDDVQSPDSADGGFAISLNDETVNLGALLMQNNSLSATITDDAIEFEMDEQMNDDNEMQDTTPQEAAECKDDESPVDSPDELSMEFEPTETLTSTGAEVFSHLEDDKAKLSSFLSRVRAAKVSRSANTHRRESLQNRRDSDVVKKALASPRHVLEEKDANLSPRRATTLTLDEVLASPLTKQKPQSILARPTYTPADVDETVEQEDELSAAQDEAQNGSPSLERRRSSRARTTRVPQQAPNKISVRTDGGDTINLNRTDAQQLADLVKKNTRKNKGAAILPLQRLMRLKIDSLATVVDGDSPPVADRLAKQGVKTVVWREELCDFATSIATADLEAAAARDEEGGAKKAPKKGGSLKVRKLKSAGGANGTPAKKVLKEMTMLDEVDEKVKEVVAAMDKSDGGSEAVAKEKKVRKTRLARPATITSSTTAMTASQETATDNATIPAATAAEDKAVSQPTTAPPSTTAQKKRESKLQPPKKLNLNPVVASLALMNGQENNIAGISSPAKKLASKIPAPASLGLSNAGPTGMINFSGLPKRSGRSGGVKK